MARESDEPPIVVAGAKETSEQRALVHWTVSVATLYSMRVAVLAEDLGGPKERASG